MPSTMIHLFIADNLKDDLKVCDRGQFYLGAISPDAVNIFGKASKELRYSAHLRSSDYNEWIDNISRFVKDNKDLSEKGSDFFKGFVVHLITDIAWDQTAQPVLFDKMLAKGVSKDELNFAKWDELCGFDNNAVELELWTKVIKPSLKAASVKQSYTVDRELLIKTHRFVVNEGFVKKSASTTSLITNDMLNAASERAYELIKTIKFN